MSHHKHSTQAGFTIIELIMVLLLSGLVSTLLYTTFNTSLSNYLGLQQDSSEFDNLTRGSQRIGTVLRGLTDITSASPNDMQLYAYFAPNDATVSLVHYYLGGSKPSLFADVTPMTANPPSGSLILSSKKTYTIIEDFVSKPGVNTFEYEDASGVILPQPVADLHTIKNIQISLAVPINVPTVNGSRTIGLNVNLRNRKTNL